MKLKLIKIGNSFGIRLPKTVIQECHFDKELELTVKKPNLILSPILKKRSNWKEMMAESVKLKPVKSEGEWEW